MNSFRIAGLLSEKGVSEAETNIRRGSIPERYVDEWHVCCRPLNPFEAGMEV